MPFVKKGQVIAVIVYIALVLSAVVLFTLYYAAPIDVSWISEVENYIKKEN